MKLSIYLPAVLICSASAPLLAAEALNLEQETTRINYSLGYQIGGDFKRQGVEMNAQAVVQGIRDALSGAKPQMSAVEMRTTLTGLKRKVVSEQRKRSAVRDVEYLTAGKQFMQENAKKEGIVTTKSGLQYKVIEAGAGKSPGPASEVTVHYRGTRIDGNEFDSSFKRGKPSTFKLNGVIKGWTEGLQLMKEGGKSQLFVPPELAYGKRGPLAHRTLVFEVELISVGQGGRISPSAQAPSPAKEQ
ncbi:MAG TPA: hypothetical protein DCO71_00490 [Gammaproteobacteria bacterium]|nr:hypothetical protein [Gammaproteobacteria bacterium]